MQRMWWGDFLEKEEVYRKKWSAVSEDSLSWVKKDRWFFGQLKRCKTVNGLRTIDRDQEQRERTLDELISKTKHCPEVCIWCLLCYAN